ncbi:MAG: DUF362 domain-containing protein [Thermoplasmata archaeon]|nr:MAG: DUF362 domain-containing protein [Thermoplasmata archaeon]
MSDVYFTKKLDIEGVLDKIFFGDVSGQRVGIKVHFGEKGCTTFVPAKHIKRICDYVEKRGGTPVLLETNVLYRGERTRASTHIKLAKEHGFDFAKIDILDGEDGVLEEAYPVGLAHYTEAYIGGSLKKYDKLIVASHFKGHILTGFAGCIKNTGMGLATRKGKLRIHASRPPLIRPLKCNKCGLCVKSCQGDAITLGFIPRIDKTKCQSCSRCIALCSKRAIITPFWSASFKTASERIVEYAYAVQKQHELIYLNFAINITRNCDCMGRAQKPIMKDVGLFGSKDLLTVDLAAWERVKDSGHEFRSKNTVRYAKKVRLGEGKYKLIDLD